MLWNTRLARTWNMCCVVWVKRIIHQYFVQNVYELLGKYLHDFVYPLFLRLVLLLYLCPCLTEVNLVEIYRINIWGLRQKCCLLADDISNPFSWMKMYEFWLDYWHIYVNQPQLINPVAHHEDYKTWQLLALLALCEGNPPLMNFQQKSQCHGALMLSSFLASASCLTNNGVTGDLECNHTHVTSL